MYCLPVTMDDDYQNDRGIEDLPEFVLVYILGLVSPYNDLNSCMLVNKHWSYLVQEVIRRRKQDFASAILTRNIYWEKIKPEPDQGPSISRRYGHSSCVHKNSLYVFGGCSYSYTTFNDLWKFDLNSREWIRPLTTGTYPSPKACASMISCGDEIWLFGGWSHSSPYPFHQGLNIYKELHSYNSVTNKWTAYVLCGEPPPSAAHSVSLLSNRYMLIFGGLKTTRTGHQCTGSNAIWLFDTKEMEWHAIRSSSVGPNARYGHSQISIDSNHIIVMGGCGGPNMQINDVWLLTIPQDFCGMWTWTQIKVNNCPIKAYLLWSSPAVKIGSTAVVLSSEAASRGCQLPPTKVIVRYKAPVNDSNANKNESHQSKTKEPNVNGKKGSFKRSHAPKNLSTSESNGPTASVSAAPEPSVANGLVSDESNTSDQDTSSTDSDSDSKPRPSIRKNASNNRQKQLEILRKYEARIRASQPHSTVSLKGIPTATSSHKRRLQVFSLDLSNVLTSHEVSWNEPLSHSLGPCELMRYTLNVGNSEIIMFGGVYRESEIDVNTNDSNDMVSKTLYFISAKHFVI